MAAPNTQEVNSHQVAPPAPVRGTVEKLLQLNTTDFHIDMLVNSIS